MKVQAYQDGLSVQAIAGTHVVLFGFDVPKPNVTELMGFAIRKTDKASPASGEFLPNFLLFEVNDKGATPDHSSYENPFQEFVWGDYTLSPAHEYRYEVTARYGVPGALYDGPSVSFDVTTESESNGAHAVFFNRGVAASQRYAEKFHNQAPQEAGPDAYAWLSRGLAEAMTAFIGRASGPGYGLRAAVYEFTWEPILKAFADALASGADVQIVYDAVDNSTKKEKRAEPRDGNDLAIAHVHLANCEPRTRTKIAHNKFIVLLDNDKPIEVWTGSTNITEGALYGQWNVGHIVRDRTVAQKYLDFWNELHTDPPYAVVRPWDAQATPVPVNLWDKPSNGVNEVFSPRSGLGALNWYATLMDGAQSSVFLTAAFGVSKELTAIFEHQKDYLRYLLLDKRTGTVKTIARSPSNMITAGGYLGERNRPWSNWLIENLTGLNKHVQYVHTKIMLIDPLSDDPIVITGSANFSDPSTTANDENMLLIRGDTRVADIYLGEFMRLFTHFRFRGVTKTPHHARAPGPDNRASDHAGKRYLRDSDSWAKRFYVKNSPRAKERELFRAPVKP
jgi:phosphatidylserine/phosphatidylglycerophosphate/cardiolipin synthase-like enzyme